MIWSNLYSRQGYRISTGRISAVSHCHGLSGNKSWLPSSAIYVNSLHTLIDLNSSNAIKKINAVVNLKVRLESHVERGTQNLKTSARRAAASTLVSRRLHERNSPDRGSCNGVSGPCCDTCSGTSWEHDDMTGCQELPDNSGV